MTDVVDTATRSRMMASIGRKDTRPEILVRRYLHGAGLRFRLHDSRLPGTPDLVFRRYRTAVFVHGCFWHRHPGCSFTYTPASRRDFWELKFQRNMNRDRAQVSALRARGWRVLIIWECETSDELVLDRLFWGILAGADHPPPT